LGRRAEFVQCDMASKESVLLAIEALKPLAPRVDILVNNAGTISGKSASEISTEEFEVVMNVNFSKQAAPKTAVVLSDEPSSASGP
jgi:NAD(P)-dependent dehydrogenase (short-subunit alcohol dehydrogenase family)